MQIFCRFRGRTLAIEVDCQKDAPQSLRAKVAGKLGLPVRALHAQGLRFSVAGKPLCLETLSCTDWTDLQTRGILAHGSEVDLLLPLAGGGGDGGATGAEDRRAWLEMYMAKKSDKAEPLEVKRALWSRCNISGEALQLPIVCDGLGSLYNKEAVLKALVEKSMPQRLSYITSLKDIVELKFDMDTSTDAKVASGGVAVEAGKFRCPVTLQEFGDPRGRFAALRSTGFVFSERALKVCRSACEEHVSASLDTPGFHIVDEDIITLNGTEEERDALRERMAAVKVTHLARPNSPNIPGRWREALPSRSTVGRCVMYCTKMHSLMQEAARAAKVAKKKKKKTAAGTADGSVEPKVTVKASQYPKSGLETKTRNFDMAPSSIAKQLVNEGELIRKRKVEELKPQDASQEVWNSLFSKKKKGVLAGEEGTFACRAIAFGGRSATS
eukprot:scaffold926_cov408-Prasinococcus_capsulatus_cf.AAC.49